MCGFHTVVFLSSVEYDGNKVIHTFHTKIHIQVREIENYYSFDRRNLSNNHSLLAF
jgi:hypothetical protein